MTSRLLALAALPLLASLGCAVAPLPAPAPAPASKAAVVDLTPPPAKTGDEKAGYKKAGDKEAGGTSQDSAAASTEGKGEPGDAGEPDEEATGDDDAPAGTGARRYEEGRMATGASRADLGASAGGDPLSARGNLWGDSIGDSFGAGGLGLSGLGLGSGGGSKGKPPTIRMGSTTVSGRLPPEVIRRIVRQNFGRLRLCYEGGLKKDQKLEGKVVVQFVIGQDGQVSSATDQGSTMKDKAVVACAVKTIQGLSFPTPEGGVVVVTYPITFLPGEPAPAAPAPAAAPAPKAPAPKAP